MKRACPNLDNKELIRFRQEYEVLKSLHSSYVIEVYAYNDTSNEYTMECMDETIYKFIQQNNGQLSLSSRKKIIAQICKGFLCIHSKNLLHRDISLTNVFIKNQMIISKNPQFTGISARQQLEFTTHLLLTD